MSVSPAARGALTVVPPSYRADLVREIDLIEEIVRLVGYENVPTTTPECRLAAPALVPSQRRQGEIRSLLAAWGLSEAIAVSFCTPQMNERFPGIGAARVPVTVLNPLTQDDTQMRLSLCPALLRAVRDNLDQGTSPVGLFSLGKVFWRDAPFAEGLRLAGVVCPTLPGRGLGRSVPPADFVDVKGLVEAVIELLALGDSQWVPATDLPSFHPGKTARILMQGVPVGVLGALHPTLGDEQGIAAPCWLFELDLGHLLQYCPPRTVFQDLPRFPAVVRDVAVVTDAGFASDQIVRFVREWHAATGWIEDVHLFDQYIGAPIPTGQKSLAYSISYRAPDRTLTDAEVNEMHTALIAALKDALQVEPR